LVDIAINFCEDRTEKQRSFDDSKEQIETACEYVLTGFLFDVLSWIPVNLMIFLFSKPSDTKETSSFDYSNLFFLLKIFRVRFITLKGSQVVRVVLNFILASYFIAIGWLLYQNIQNLGEQQETGEQNFLKLYLLGKSEVDQAILATYFAASTISTVGLGDFTPVTDTDR
jgi:hypothetical protein